MHCVSACGPICYNVILINHAQMKILVEIELYPWDDKKVFGAGKYPQLPKTLREIPLSGQRADLLFRVVEGEVREISQIRQHRFCKPKKSDWPVKKNTEKKLRWGDFKAFIVSGTTSVPPFHCLASNTNLVITEQIIWMDIGSRWSCLLWTDGVCHAITCS